jgi:hypothetical protein
LAVAATSTVGLVVTVIMLAIIGGLPVCLCL